MDKIKAVFKIIRPLNILITFISVIVGGIIALKSNFIPQSLLFAALAEALTFSSGNIINDIFDLEIDKINRPERVLPSRIITINLAGIIYLLFALLAVYISYNINPTVFKIILITNIILFLYSFIIKKMILIDNVIVSVIVGSAFIVGSASVGNISAGYIPFVFALLINFTREIVKDIEDIKGDSASGIKSFPSVFGFGNSKIIILLSTIVLIIITFYPYIFDIYGFVYLLIILIVVDPFLVFILIKLFKNDTIENFKKVSIYLKVTMLFGLIAIYLG
ncbi:MAG: hypothetical protein COW08_03050 [Ignavibacteriales bacterium CG12_big_fil_rev_8_21_14_0_65_30_8]|nr:MAG: hypothetical protein COW08_03050 [Ignavibacteriales bacterium CG12_big_fil_rev_8_21_14_0_65_30_8]